ncbi:hypothetical protein [Deinococcus hohokamensis]|uniref:Uncharacterized protein n=1 Tax=Deinococcus hohokamensis TaxID=309883 RepID=A0ABV9IAK8_9DEIO
MSTLRIPAGRAVLQGSALARPIDPSLASNRFAVAGALTAALGARVLGRRWAEALGVGGAAFLAWATARELDPDHPETAATALMLSAGVAWLGRSGHPVTGVGVLSGLRLLAGTVGRDPLPLDLAAVTVQAALMAGSGEQSSALLPALSGVLTPGSPAPWSVAGVLAPGVSRGAGTSVPAALLVLLALALSPVLTAPEAVQAGCDHPPRTIDPLRVQQARQAGAWTLLGGLMTGQTRSLVPLAAAALAVGRRRRP